MARTDPRWIAGGVGAVALILTAVAANEGGFVDHKDDPGGPTNHGVTQANARKHGYQGDMRHFPKRCWTIDDVCADRVLIVDYLEKPGFGPILDADDAVAEELFDSAVNFGPPRPSRWFQESLNELAPVKLRLDGIVGPKTVQAFRAYQASAGRAMSCHKLLDRLDGKQRAEYDRLVRANPRLKVFYRGWINKRVGNVSRARCWR